MDNLLVGMRQNIVALNKLKQSCHTKALQSIYKWAEQISSLQLEYRKLFDTNFDIINVCKKCSLCCTVPVGVGKLSPQDLLYYSCLNIDLSKYYSGTPGMCPFWNKSVGCGLPKNARPMACVHYVCAINPALQEHKTLHDITSRLDSLYKNMPPIEISLDKTNEATKEKSQGLLP